MAEAALIGAAADTAKGLAQLVAARALDEFNLAWGFKDQLRKLNKKFEYIQAFLEDAANSKYAQKSKLVKLWVQKVKDVAYLADDVMDEYAIEIFRRKMELKNRSSSKFREFFTLSNPVIFRLRMAHKVNEILTLFNEIDKDAKDIGLNPVDFTTKTSATATSNEDRNLSQIRDYAAASAAEFVGRVKDETELLDFICSPLTEKHHLSTVAIVGMGGVGKTTFARRLSDHERICAHFGDNKIWVTVGENFEINKLLNMMLESVTTSNLELSSFDAIKRKLQEKLKGNKYFLVFDDVWNENENLLWDSLKGLLPTIGIGPGSVILTTTRSDDVATAADAAFKHKLKGLSTEESWSLFYQIVSNKKMQPIHYSLEEVGKRIVKKCGGVPLAIKVMGGLLRSKPNLRKWESIERSELWDLPQGHDHILPSLLLSFSHLSSPIKQCFSYFAIFPRGCIFGDKIDLFSFWLAQGYLRNDGRKNMTFEEIGEVYLNILLSNSLVECVQTPAGSLGYKTHDLLYDLAVYVFGSDLIKKVEDLSEEGSCRHLAINSKGNTSTSCSPPEKALAKLRTLYLVRTTPGTMLTHTKYLRALLIGGASITEISSDIALLKHLRLLYVGYNPITTLPDSISKLYQLQTLGLQCCPNMEKLPKVVNKLPNLRHILTIAPMFAWKGLQQLTNLQTLPSLALNDHGEDWSIDELGYLHKLRGEVHILGLECVKDKENARKAGFAQKANVTNLKLSWVEGKRSSELICDEDVLEGLEPHSNITSLEVLNFLGLRFPEWIMKMGVLTEGPSTNRTQLDNLHTVKLLNCSRCETLPKLGQLPLLKFLTLSGLDVEIIGTEFYGGDVLGMGEVVSFKSLQELEISKFRRLTTWREPPRAAFPSLETLRIKDCSALESVPAFEFRSLTTLELEDLISVESLDIIKCSSGLISLTMNGLPKIESLPQEIANCRKLQILNIYNFDKLASLPTGLEALVNLRSLEVAHCAVLNFIMDDFLHIRSSLCTLGISNCPNLRTIPSSLEECAMLNTLFIRKCPMIKGPHTNISKLQQLSELRMSFWSAKQLRSMLASAKDLPVLRRLEIEGFRNEEEMKDYFSDMTPFLNLPSLTELILYGYPKIKTLPEQLGVLTRITHLYIWEFDDLEESLSWICNLTSLRCLIIEDCNKLKGLPSKEDMECLIHLRIANCPLLVERYAKDGGSEWDNISHIRWIIMNGNTIQYLS